MYKYKCNFMVVNAKDNTYEKISVYYVETLKEKTPDGLKNRTYYYGADAKVHHYNSILKVSNNVVKQPDDKNLLPRDTRWKPLVETAPQPSSGSVGLDGITLVLQTYDGFKNYLYNGKIEAKRRDDDMAMLRSIKIVHKWTKGIEKSSYSEFSGGNGRADLINFKNDGFKPYGNERATDEYMNKLVKLGNLIMKNEGIKDQRNQKSLLE